MIATDSTDTSIVTGNSQAGTVEFIVEPAEEEELPILWLGPVEYAPDLLPQRKQRGRCAPVPPVPPP